MEHQDKVKGAFGEVMVRLQVVISLFEVGQEIIDAFDKLEENFDPVDDFSVEELIAFARIARDVYEQVDEKLGVCNPLPSEDNVAFEELRDKMADLDAVRIELEHSLAPECEASDQMKALNLN